MGKRFRDTELWGKEWYVALSCAERCAIDYILCRCDAVGVWAPAFSVAGRLIGDEVDWEALPGKVNGNIAVLEDGKWWMRDFCAYQYGRINPESESKVQQSLYALLLKHGLWDAYLATVAPTVRRTVQEKEKEKEEEKEKVRDQEKDKEFFHGIEEGFKRHNGGKFTDYPKEGKAIHGLIAKARARDREHAQDLLVSVCAAFWKLKQTDQSAKGYWRDMPFLPSRLNSSSIWDGVLESMRREEIDPAVKAIIEGGIK